MKKFSLAIIGGGAATVTFLKSLISLINPEENPLEKIVVFDKNPNPGFGLAYQDDVENLLVNRPLQKMSAHPWEPSDFTKWIKTKKEHQAKIIDESKIHNDDISYVSRKTFGFYLKETFDNTILEAKKKGTIAIFVADYVNNLVFYKLKNEFLVQTEGLFDYFFDFVILCNGHSEPQDLYHLGETPKYVNNPYPINKKMRPVINSKDIAIIGNSLTAFDVAISLRETGFHGHITMISRKKCYPMVRGKTINYNPKFMNHSLIEKATKNNKKISLRDILRALRSELKLHGYNWKSFFIESDPKLDFITHLKQEISLAQTERKWQSIFGSTNEIIEQIWENLDSDSKNIFMAHFHRFWLNSRTPIPITNAKILLTMAESGTLFMTHNIFKITYDSKTEKYKLFTQDGDRGYFDAVINATGPSRHVDEQDKFMSNLLFNGLSKKNTMGGIAIDFDSSAVIDERDMINYRLRAIGHPTIGTYYYTSSMEMIAKRSFFIAENLLEEMLGCTA